MSAQTRARPQLHRAGKHACPGGLHEYPHPLRGQRPVVVFCSRCQSGKTIQ